MTEAFKKRLQRLEKDASLRRESTGQEILESTLKGLSLEELELLKSFVARGARSAEATPDERAAIERYEILYEGNA